MGQGDRLSGSRRWRVAVVALALAGSGLIEERHLEVDDRLGHTAGGRRALGMVDDGVLR